MSRISARPEWERDYENGKMREIVDLHSNDLFFYNCQFEYLEGTIKAKLAEALSCRQVIVSSQPFYQTLPEREVIRIFPADIGSFIKDRFYTFSSVNQLLEVAASQLRVDQKALMGALQELVFEESKCFEGGYNVEVAGSKRVFTIYPPISDRDNRTYIYLPGLAQATFLLSSYPELTGNRERLLYRGHVDLTCTACNTSRGIEFYVYDKLLEFLRANRDLGFLDEHLNFAIPVPPEYVFSGGLNLKYVDGKALVPTRGAVFPPLLECLERIGYEPVELGEEEFNLLMGYGVKCNSLSLSWRR